MVSVSIGILAMVEFETGVVVLMASGVVGHLVGAGAEVVACREFASLPYACDVAIGLYWN